MKGNCNTGNSISVLHYLMCVVIFVQVTVHVSDSEDEDEEEIFDEEGGEGDGGEGGGGGRGDPEAGGKGYPVDNGPPTSCIVPIYRYLKSLYNICEVFGWLRVY